MSATSDAPSLRLDARREEALARATAIVTEAWRSFDQARPGEPRIGERLEALLRDALPGDGSSVLAALDDAASVLDVSIAQPRPRFFAFVGSSGLEIGVIGDVLASCFDVNLAVWSGAASAVEDQAIRWVGEFVGYPAAAGAFTSGGTISNVTALAAARERALPGSRHDGVRGGPRRVYCSREAHYSVVRAAELLGLGSESVRSLPLDDRRRLRPGAVAQAIDADVAAGVAPSRWSRRRGRRSPAPSTGATPWRTVRAARRLAPRGRSVRRSRRVDAVGGDALRRDRAADSVALDAHKWLFLPKACGVVLVRRRETSTAPSRTRRTTSRTSGPSTTSSTSRSSTRGRSAR